LTAGLGSRHRRRRRALVLQPRLRPLGGAEGVAAWILEALHPDCAVTLACRERPDLGAVDRRYGTSLRSSDFAILILPDVPAPRLRLENLRSWWLQRQVRGMARSFDLTIGAASEADLGEGTIQYVHTVTQLYQPRGGRDLGWFHAGSLAGAAYLAASARLTGFDVARMRATGRWSARTGSAAWWAGSTASSRRRSFHPPREPSSTFPGARAPIPWFGRDGCGPNDGWSW
jgi:hypothetical protein